MWPFRKKPKEPEIIVPDEELIANYLKDPVFKHRLVEVGEHTAQLGLEGGFAVYKRPGGEFIVSQAVLPDPSWWLYTTRAKNFSQEEKDSMHPSRQFPSHILTEYYRPGIKPRNAEQDSYWRQDWSAYKGVRKDIAFTLHSHPGYPDSKLVPSNGDIGNWSDIEDKNPFFVDAILVSNGALIKILMWRRAQSETYTRPLHYVNDKCEVETDDYYQENYLQYYRYVRSAEDFITVSPKLGFNAVVATYNSDRNRLYPAANSIAEQLVQ